MKAICVPQLEAWLIIHGHLHLLNRPRNVALRGRVLIYAEDSYGDEDEQHERYSALFPDLTIPDFFEHGGIVGQATIHDCVSSDDSPLFEGPFALVLRHASPTTYYRCRAGSSFLFDVSDNDLRIIGVRD